MLGAETRCKTLVQQQQPRGPGLARGEFSNTF